MLKAKPFKEGYVVNPKTNRYVKITGKLGQQILHQIEDESEKSELPDDVLIIIGNAIECSQTRVNFFLTNKLLLSSSLIFLRCFKRLKNEW